MQLTIEKMVYGGDGLARWSEPGDARHQAVFLPFVLPGEAVEAHIVEKKKGFLRGRMQKLVNASAQRAEPGCPYFLRCGGCHYQHATYEHQVEIKTAILRETLQRTGGMEWREEIQVHPSPPWNYRNRTRMKLRTAPFALGYFRTGSHSLLPVEQCPISSPLINKAISAIWELGRSGIAAACSEIEFFADSDDGKVLLELHGMADEQRSREFAVALRERLPQLAGVAGFPAAASTPVVLFGEAMLLYRAAGGSYRVSAGAFFQISRFLADELVSTVCEGQSGKLAWDLYAGVGLFSLPLAQHYTEVVAVEAEPISFADLQDNAGNQAAAIHGTTEEFLGSSSAKPDLVVVDPPRAGLGAEVTRELARIAPAEIAYVSCDPATLSRDLRLLIQSGYRVRQIHLVDLFPQTFHIESVVHLVR